MFFNLTRCLGVAAFATMAALPLTAHATPFGAATIGFSNATVEPTYTIGTGSGTITFNGQLDTKAATVETGLEDIRVLIGDDKHRVFLMPAAGNTCVAVTVDTTFAP